jgi:phage terminase large subunit
MRIDWNDELSERFMPLLWNKDRFLILQGSAGSGKSVSVAKKLVWRCLRESKHRHLVLRKVAKDIEESFMQEVIDVIDKWGIKATVRKGNKPKIWIDDSEFIFTGLDNPERIKSVQGITSITCEELSEFTEDDFDQLNLRLRGDKPYYKQTIGLLNPIDENHWVKRRFVDDPPKTLSYLLHKSSYLDNPWIDEDYKRLLEGYKETNTLYYQIYCLNEWGVVDTSKKFLYSFDQDKHISPCTLDENYAVKLSFDFNLEPFAVSVYQTPDRNTVNVIDKVRLNNSDIYQVCDHIKAKYPSHFFIVTGDASGKNRTGTSRGKTSYWRIIKRELNLKDAQIQLRSMNLGLIESRVLCNSALQHKNINIDPSQTELINDCKYATVDDKGILVKDRNKNANDFLDGFRYALDVEFKELIRNPKNVRK